MLRQSSSRVAARLVVPKRPFWNKKCPMQCALGHQPAYTIDDERTTRRLSAAKLGVCMSSLWLV